jgi:hypothetical protein
MQRMPGAQLFGAPPPVQPAPQPQRRVAPPQPKPPATTSANLPKPTVRGVAPDSAPLKQTAEQVRLLLPDPEALGIKVVANAPPPQPAAAVDWNAVHARLDRLGIVNYQRDRLPQGGFRVAFALGAPQAHQVEATGDSEAAAVLQALARAEALVAQR